MVRHKSRRYNWDQRHQIEAQKGIIEWINEFPKVVKEYKRGKKNKK